MKHASCLSRWPSGLNRPAILAQVYRLAVTMGRDQRKQQKQKKREQRNAEQKKYAQRLERRRQYPKIVFDAANGDPEFVEAVRAALATIDFDDTKLFKPIEQTFYKLIRERGRRHAFGATNELLRSSSLSPHEQEVTRVQLILGFGSRLLERIQEETRRRLMPYNDVLVDFREHDIVLKFSSLRKEKGAGGTLYFSRRRPTVEFGGRKYTIAFSRHAIERICERINPHYIQYAAAGDVYGLFADCVYVEPFTLHGGQPAFVLYADCGEPPFVSYAVYVKEILGEKNVDPEKGKCYYRVGYCPVAFEGDFAKATTMLFPGYSGTPEYGLVRQSKLSREKKDSLIETARLLNANEVMLTDNHQIIKWFHNNGVPQVVQMTRQVFVPHGSR